MFCIESNAVAIRNRERELCIDRKLEKRTEGTWAQVLQYSLQELSSSFSTMPKAGPASASFIYLFF